MRCLLQLAAAVALLPTLASGALAQLPWKHDKLQTEDLSWMWQYTQPAPKGNETALRADTHFRSFLEKNLIASQTFWGYSKKSLPDAVLEFLEQPRAVVAEDNRFITATGCTQGFCGNRGLLWVDLGATHPLIVFAATTWIAENKATDQEGATYTLWVFSNRALDPEHLPPSLKRSIGPWAAEPIAGDVVEQITNVILVDPDGQPHATQPAAIGIDQPKQTEQKAKP